jgi:DNA-binding transcriptional LysR family regulator
MPLSLRLLKSFVAVAEELHFGAAAARLHMTQPPLSQQVRQLEEALGTALLHRTTRVVQLTAAGEVLLIRARQMLADSDATELAVRRAAEGAIGSLGLGFTASAAYRLLPRAVVAYRSAYPEVRLELQEMLSSALVSSLRSHLLDVALLRLSHSMLEDDLEYAEVAREPMMLAVPRAHPLAGLDRVAMAELDGVPFIAFANSGSRYFREILERMFANASIQPKVVQESVLPTMLAMVEAGLGVALVPASVEGMREQQVVYKRVADAGADATVVLHCAWRKGESGAAVRNFVRLLQAGA